MERLARVEITSNNVNMRVRASRRYSMIPRMRVLRQLVRRPVRSFASHAQKMEHEAEQQIRQKEVEMER
jgi:hypothetical protein